MVVALFKLVLRPLVLALFFYYFIMWSEDHFNLVFVMAVETMHFNMVFMVVLRPCQFVSYGGFRTF